MKLQIIKPILIIVLAFSLQSNSYLANSSKSIKVTAQYDGLDDMGYNFSNEVKGVIKTLTFDEIKDELIEKFDLDNDTYVGEKFELTYSVSKSDDEAIEDTLILESLKLVEE
ncbi:hypothetical protein ACOSP6_06945 [Tenacibaculum sp. MEBiC06402]|uniref:hypothetical protein n=1 Tax=unclassified Tenacibaculum TaxID=2635139 RepID=UPI003B9B13F4